MRRRQVENSDATGAGFRSDTFSDIDESGGLDPSPYGYSHVAVLRRDCRTIYMQVRAGRTNRESSAPDFGTQVRQASSNLQTALKGAGASVADVAKLTVLIVDHTEDKLRLFGSELKEAFGPGPKPACTLIPVPRLALDAMLVEVEAVAAEHAQSQQRQQLQDQAHCEPISRFQNQDEAYTFRRMYDDPNPAADGPEDG